MKDYYNNRKGTARYVIVVCGFLFCLYTFAYLLKVQGIVLGMAQHVLSHGLTAYSPWIGAAVLTFLLQALQVALNRVVPLQREWYCLSYFPSFLTLALLTSVDESAYEGFSWGNWAWGFPLGLIVYFLLALFLQRLPSSFDDRKGGAVSRKLIPNLVFFIVLCIGSMSLSRNSEVMHYQLKTEYLLSLGKVGEALEVGRQAQATNRPLTALRAYALYKQGELSEKLFTYPQQYGAEGLMLQRADTVRMIFSPDSLFRNLGAYPRSSREPALEYLELLDRSKQARQPMAQEYLLCAYLLNGSLDKFVRKLSQVYDLNDSALVLPRYYQEALVLYQRRNPGRFAYSNPVQETNLEDYLNVVRATSNTMEGRNKARRDFGTTFWWYYDSLIQKNKNRP